ncbi:MAG: hypothetical protein ACM3NV_01260 [Syntrophothermus sp.]
MTTGTEEQATELRELRSQREAMHRELVRKSYRIGELEQQVAEVSRSFEESLSWRVTRPLRAAGALSRRLRHR